MTNERIHFMEYYLMFIKGINYLYLQKHIHKVAGCVNLLKWGGGVFISIKKKTSLIYRPCMWKYKIFGIPIVKKVAI